MTLPSAIEAATSDALDVRSSGTTALTKPYHSASTAAERLRGQRQLDGAALSPTAAAIAGKISTGHKPR